MKLGFVNIGFGSFDGLNVAGTGRSLVPLLEGRTEPGRDAAFFGRERHANVRRGDLAYPSRAIRTADWLYIRNLRPGRWPAGDPEKYRSVGDFGDVDEGPTKSLLRARRAEPQITGLFEAAFGLRPDEELYDLKSDPDQLRNVAAEPAHAALKAQLKARLDAWRQATGDPVSDAPEEPDPFDAYEYFGERPRGTVRQARRDG